MKELEFLNVIKNQIGTEFIGDDCAYLKDFNLVISQDNFVENIHFKKEWYTPFQLGYKSVVVSISDILASGAKPVYVTIGLSLPSSVDSKYINDFYKGAKEALYGAKIVGGDITGSDKIMISVTVLGDTLGRKISSRANAKAGYKIITRGSFGKSSLGLRELLNNGSNIDLVNAHIMPRLDINFSEDIAKKIDAEYAMMDTSDGLADALFKVAESSGVSIECDEINGIYAAEDYVLIAAVPEDFIKKMKNVNIIANVIEKKDFIIKIGNRKFNNYDELGLYNHFEE